ncbi:hypothetical protein AGMMS50218_05570 [Actinomycetota bacterium]|nr:hypothetical protein AGMMS50218_05570 [Actinomycetota bacterium]
MTRLVGPRRIGALLALVGLSVSTLTGCFLGDHVPPRASLINRTSASVTLTITGADIDPQDFPAREGRPVRGLGGVVVDAETCVGDGFLVTDTASGAVLITSDEPVCGDTTIIVEADPTPLTPPPAPPASTP